MTEDKLRKASLLSSYIRELKYDRAVLQSPNLNSLHISVKDGQGSPRGLTSNIVDEKQAFAFLLVVYTQKLTQLEKEFAEL